MIYEKRDRRTLTNFLSTKIKEKNILKIEANNLPLNSPTFSEFVGRLNIIRNDIYNFFSKHLSGVELESLRSVNLYFYESSSRGFLEKCSLLEEKLNIFLREFYIDQDGNISLKQKICNIYESISIVKRIVIVISCITSSIISIFPNEIKKLLTDSYYIIFR